MLFRRKTRKISLLLLFLISFFSGQAQEIIAEEGSFVVDDTNKIIIWNNQGFDTRATTFTFNRTFKVVDTEAISSVSNPVAVEGDLGMYTLYRTKLPIVHLQINQDVEDDVKRFGDFSYYDFESFLKSGVGIEHRGNLSLTFPKKSYDLEFWIDAIRKQSKDLQFKGMRSDDDWILDALYNEPLRIRSTIAAELWLKMSMPDYIQKESKAKSGFKVRYVEVLKNGIYLGVYALSEPVDRKLLELKANEGKIVHGELFKAAAYEGGPSFKKSPEYDNLFPHWAGFEMKFPLVNYKAHWNDLAKFVDLVVNANDANFSAQIGQHLDIDNAINYFLLVNLLRATDNLGKNYYLAKYDTNEPYFFVPWDLDGVLGVIQEGKRIPTTNDVLSNGLFDRLLSVNPNGYRNQLKARWHTLRQKEFSEKELLHQVEKMYSKFNSEKVYEREFGLWKSTYSQEEDFDYLTSWIKNRLVYLDTYFEGL